MEKKSKGADKRITDTAIMKLFLSKFAYDSTLLQPVSEEWGHITVHESRRSSQHFYQVIWEHFCEAMKIAKRAFYERIELRENVGNII